MHFWLGNVAPAGKTSATDGAGGRSALGGLTSLQGRLSVISLSLFGLMIGFGLLTIHLFNGFNSLSDELRGVWLPRTRLLGDLNNDTSDYRAAEGDTLLATMERERALHRGIAAELGRNIARSQHEYETIPHSDPESRLYTAFANRWNAYQRTAARVMQLAASGNAAQAARLYNTDSRKSYDAASDALGALTAHNVDMARNASTRTARAYAEGRLLIVLALILAASLLAASLTFIRRWISEPLTELAHTMRRLAANTTDITIAGTSRADEIGEMARAVTVFRANAVELIQSQRGLAQQAAMLEQKLAYEQELARMQRNFVAMISHEFRTPLAAIDAHAQRLVNMRDHITPGDIAERAGRVRSAVHRITSLMDNLLNASRLMDGAPKLFFHPKEIDISALLHEVCRFHREASPNAFISEDFTSGLTVIADDKLLFQTFSNLLSNAIKYSPDDVVVRIKAWRDEIHTVVTMCDRGLGIPAQDRENLFKRYYRGGNVSGIVGTGVGLYLAKNVLHLHGGEVTVESEEGRGSCFTVRLPHAQVSEQSRTSVAAAALDTQEGSD
jgi:signal transduction histidine kinase